MDCRETLTTSDSKPQLCDVVRIFFVLIMSMAASVTVLTHIAQISGMPFSTYAIICTCVAVIVAGYVLWREFSKQVLVAITAHRMQALSLLACCMFGGLLSLVSHRHAFDDIDYVPNAVYYVEHPSEPMGYYIHYLDSGSEPFVSHHISTSLPFEYCQAIVAYVAHTHFLNVYYFLEPAFVGCMIPLVWFYIISRFGFATRAAIAGAFFICLSLILLGEQHRSFGNLSFNRIYQGKTVLLAVGIPLFSALTIDFFRSPDRRKWSYLFISSVAMVGLSNSAAVLIPLLAGVLAASCIFPYVLTMKARVLCILSYFCTLVYPILYAGSILLLSLKQVSKNSTVNEPFPLTFSGHAEFVLGGPVVMSFLICGVISAIILIRKRDRYFLATWVILIMALYLNPVVAPFMIEHVTSPNIYWRLFYLLPFPLVIGLSCAAVASWLGSKRQIWRYIAFAAMTVLLLAGHVPSSSSSVFRRGSRVTKLGLPKYKYTSLRQAREVLDLASPTGVMLAAPRISQSLPLLTSQYPQMCTRLGNVGIVVFMSQRGEQIEAEYRMQASRLLGGELNKEGVDCLVWLIRHRPRIRSIVADRRVAKAGNSYLSRLLNELGFTDRKFTDEFAVFIRPGDEIGQ